jgi:type II secretory pathway pseudopilin PulG
MKTRGRPAPGYVLVELLVSTAIAAALLGVLLQFVVAAQGTVRAQADAADVQQRLRAAIEKLRGDLLNAGAGPSRGAGRGPLAGVFAPVIPARTGTSGADDELSYHADRISILSVAAVGAETTIRVGMASASAPLQIDAAAPGCAAGGDCGFSRGERALIFEPVSGGGAYETFTVADTGAQWITAVDPLSRPYPSGSRVVAVDQRVYYLDRPGKRLMVYDGNRSDLPLVDHVVDLKFVYYADPAPGSVPPPRPGESNCAYAAGAPPLPLLDDLGGGGPKLVPPGRLTDGPACGLAPNRFDADLLRIRRIGVTIRVESEAAELRGSGAAFFTPGTSRGGYRSSPDMQVAFDVAPRNMALR